MKISIKYRVVIKHLTKCRISQSVFNQLTCSWATFEGVIEGHKRPVSTSLNRSIYTSLSVVFHLKFWKTKTGLGPVFFRSWTGLETGPSSTMHTAPQVPVPAPVAPPAAAVGGGQAGTSVRSNTSATSISTFTWQWPRQWGRGGDRPWPGQVDAW